MRILYFTNIDVKDDNSVVSILEGYGDEVIRHTDRVNLSFVQEQKVDWIVSDRPRYLIRSDVLNVLHRRIVNLHPTFLPWNRGYHPNFWTVVDNSPCGVTVHYIDEGIDTGDIITQTRVYYNDEDTLRTIYDRLRRHMVSLFAATWPDLRNEKAASKPQDLSDGNLHYKKDFDSLYEQLPNGWDTEVAVIREKFGK